MLLDDFTAVLASRDSGDVLREAVRFTKSLDFDTVTVFAVQDLENYSLFRGVDNVPAAAASLHGDMARGRADPVMQYCKRSHLPLAWNRNTYASAGKLEMWEEQETLGFAAGLAVACHLPAGRHFLVGVDRCQPLPSKPAQITWMAARLQLFAACALEVSTQILLDRLPTRQIVPLTPRELEALRWTMEGKTAWELGCILGISEQTAARHINRATRKLDCINKVQAVVKALRLGLIQ